MKLSTKQVEELIDLVDKEGILEVEDKIEKALQKDKEVKDAEKVAEKQLSEGKAAAPSEEKTNEKTEKNQKDSPTPRPPKPKMDSKSIIAPPPSIDPNSKSDSSKML